MLHLISSSLGQRTASLSARCTKGQHFRIGASIHGAPGPHCAQSPWNPLLALKVCELLPNALFRLAHGRVLIPFATAEVALHAFINNKHAATCVATGKNKHKPSCTAWGGISHFNPDVLKLWLSRTERTEVCRMKDGNKKRRKQKEKSKSLSPTTVAVTNWSN